MYSHNRPNVTEYIKVPNTKRTRLLLVVRNPVLHKASIYFESVCRYGLHIKSELPREIPRLGLSVRSNYDSAFLLL